MAGKKKNGNNSTEIAVNRRAKHDYFIEERYEAGLSLQGWEVKSLRAGKANISEAYVMVKEGQVLLIGATINPLTAVRLISSWGSHSARVIPSCRCVYTGKVHGLSLS